MEPIYASVRGKWADTGAVTHDASSKRNILSSQSVLTNSLRRLFIVSTISL